MWVRLHQLLFAWVCLLVALQGFAHLLAPLGVAGGAGFWAWVNVNLGMWFALAVLVYSEEMHGFVSRGFRRFLLGAILAAGIVTLFWPQQADFVVASSRLLGAGIVVYTVLCGTATWVMLRKADPLLPRTSFYHPGVRMSEGFLAARYNALVCMVFPPVILMMGAVDWYQTGSLMAGYFPKTTLVISLWTCIHFFGINWLYWQQLSKASQRTYSELTTRLAHKQAELRATYEQLNEQTRKQTVLIERQRIRDALHANLVAVLDAARKQVQTHEVGQPEVSALIAQVIDDLYLTIDSIEVATDDLLLLLAIVRFRLEPSIQRMNARLIWSVQPVPPLHWLNPSSSLSILRTVYIAMKRLLVGAQGSVLQLDTWHTDSEIVVQMQNEVGNPESPQHWITHSVEENWLQGIGGRVVWRTVPANAVRLHLPLHVSPGVVAPGAVG